VTTDNGDKILFLPKNRRSDEYNCFTLNELIYQKPLSINNYTHRKFTKRDKHAILEYIMMYGVGGFNGKIFGDSAGNTPETNDDAMSIIYVPSQRNPFGTPRDQMFHDFILNTPRIIVEEIQPTEGNQGWYGINVWSLVEMLWSLFE
jgi:hypothetical protein